VSYSNAVVYQSVKKILGPHALERYNTDTASRIKIQKTIYMLQEKSGKHCYEFGWCMSGPFSAELDAQCRSMCDELNGRCEGE